MDTQTPPNLTWKLHTTRPPGEWVTLQLEFFLGGVWLLNYQDKFHAVQCIDMSPAKAQTIAGCVWDRLLSTHPFALPFKSEITALLAEAIGRGLPRPPPLPPVKYRHGDPPPRALSGGDMARGKSVPVLPCALCLILGFVVGLLVGGTP